MKITHTFRNHSQLGSVPVTLVQDSDEFGNPVFSSLRGHLHEQIVINMLKAYRASDARLER